ncbi:MAG TPA: hypothetical protein VFY71_12040 [Planctomycetota bacterium]|nr:hypothetical protein [Planctomycetota bacterium]
MIDPDAFFKRDEYLLDLSLVADLPNIRRRGAKIMLLVPRTLHEVLTAQPTPELARLLSEAVLPADATPEERDRSAIGLDELRRLQAAYHALIVGEVVRIIEDEELTNPDLRASLVDWEREDHTHATVGIPSDNALTPPRLVGRHLGTLLGRAKREGTAILAAGRRLASRVGAALPTLVLPDRLVGLLKKKEEFSERVFSTPRAKAGKVVIGLLITLPALAAYPAVAALGTVLTLIDP